MSVAMEVDGARSLRENEETGSPASRARRLVGGVALALLALAAAWLVASAYQRSHVHVLLDSAALTCDGAPVHVGRSAEGVSVPMADLTKGMDCALRFRVANEGPLSVKLTRVRLPLMGSEAAAGVSADLLQGHGARPDAGEVDAVFDLPPSTISAGESLGVEVRLLRQPGCTQRGTSLVMTDAPIATIRSFGVPGARSPVGPVFGFRGTEASFDGDCG